MKSLESRRHRALDDVSDNEYLEKEFRRKMANAGPLIFNDQAEDEMFSERDVEPSENDQAEDEMFSERDVEPSENDQAEDAMFSERDAGKATIDVAIKEIMEIQREMEMAQKRLDDLVKRAGSIEKRRGELRDSK